jgi:glycosyltransferase involved in cell wall biosynthesis
VARLLAGFQNRGHRVLSLCRNQQVANAAAAYGIPTGVRVLGGDAMFPHALAFAWMLRSERPDALLLTSFKKSWLGGLAAKMAGVPRSILRVGALPNNPGGRTYRIALSHWVDAVALNADAMRSPLIAALPTVPAHKFVTIYDGVAEHPRSNAGLALRRKLSIGDARPLIGSVGRLVKQKRYDRLLRAFAQLPEDVHCVIAGEGPELDPLRRLASELGIAHRTHLPGFRSDVSAILDALDVFVLSSDFEGMANAMLEAMAAGVPIVSTRVSGAEEALFADPRGSDPPGVIVGFEPSDIAAECGRLLSNPSVRQRMGQAGIQRVRESFTFDRMLDEWELIFVQPKNRN